MPGTKAGNLLPAQIARLSPLERLSLSEYLIRRGDPDNAIKLLDPLLNNGKSPIDFLLYCNRATAHQQVADKGRGANVLDRYFLAKKDLAMALKLWPRTWEELVSLPKLAAMTWGSPSLADMGNLVIVPWDADLQHMLSTFDWSHVGPGNTFYRCRKGEEYFLKLLESRYQELGPKKTKKSLDVELDALFTDGKRSIRYVDENGQFAPGKLAAAERTLLPEGNVDSAIEIVQQLLIWLPLDFRLYRQLGELYSVRGGPKDLLAAREIFEELVIKYKFTENEDVRLRRQELNNTSIPADPEHQEPQAEIPINDRKTSDNPENKVIVLKEQFDWQTLTVTFVFGFSVGLVGLWQVQEILRRKRRHAPPTSPPPSGPASSAIQATRTPGT